MEENKFISEVIREKCKDKYNKQCFEKLKIYVHKIIKNSLYRAMHEQMAAEVLYSSYEYLNRKHKDLFPTFEFYYELLQNRLNGMDVIYNKRKDKAYGLRGKSQGKIIYIKEYVLEENDKYRFILLFSHELAHILSSGYSSIGLIYKKRLLLGRNDNSSINIVLKSLQEKTVGSFHTYLNEMETDYLALKFVNENFIGIKEEFSYEFPLKEGKLLIKYSGSVYVAISCFAPVINHIFNNELEKTYLEDKGNIMLLLNMPKYKYLKKGLFRFESKCKRVSKCKNGLYSKARFDSYFKSYICLLRIYIQKTLLDDEQQKEFMGIVQGVFISLNNKNYLNEIL